MKEPFVFRQVSYLVEATGRRAASLDELLRGVSLVPARSISYHMHREFLAHRFVREEWPNDFAYWVARIIGDEILAERLADLNVFRYRSLEELRTELARLIADHLTTIPDSAHERALPGRELYFQSNRSLVLRCPQRGTDLKTFAASLRSVPSSSIYYHLFETRFSAGNRQNDFAAWLDQSLGLHDLAAKVDEVDPYMFSLEEARHKVLSLITDHRLDHHRHDDHDSGADKPNKEPA